MAWVSEVMCCGGQCRTPVGRRYACDSFVHARVCVLRPSCTRQDRSCELGKHCNAVPCFGPRAVEQIKPPTELGNQMATA